MVWKLRNPLGLPELPPIAAVVLLLLFLWPFLALDQGPQILLWEMVVWALAIVFLALLGRGQGKANGRRTKG